MERFISDEALTATKTIIEGLKGTTIKEIEYSNEHTGVKIRIVRKIGFGSRHDTVQNQNTTPEEDESFTDHTRYPRMLSAFTGTFFRAQRPELPPFINVGDVVEKGQPLCIIETMKIMNEIISEYHGKVVKIVPENESLVMKDSELVIIDTEGFKNDDVY